MRYQNMEVTLDNYQDIFSQYPLDILDEIRSALLDGLPILNYLNRSPEDLHQIRLAMLEGISAEFFTLPASLLKSVRSAVTTGHSLTCFQQYLNKGIDTALLRVILDWDLKGYSIANLPLEYLTEDNVPLFTSMLRRNVNIQPYLTARPVPLESLKYVVKLNRPDLLEDLPALDVLQYLCSHRNLLGYKITSQTSLDTLEALQALYASALRKQDPTSYKELTQHDEKGNFLYMPFQLDRVLDAFEKHYDYKRLMDPSLGMSALNTLLLEEEFKQRKRLGGKL